MLPAAPHRQRLSVRIQVRRVGGAHWIAEPPRREIPTRHRRGTRRRSGTLPSVVALLSVVTPHHLRPHCESTVVSRCPTAYRREPSMLELKSWSIATQTANDCGRRLPESSRNDLVGHGRRQSKVAAERGVAHSTAMTVFQARDCGEPGNPYSAFGLGLGLSPDHLANVCIPFLKRRRKVFGRRQSMYRHTCGPGSLNAR